MKQIMSFLKVMCILSVFLLANSIYSQSACQPGYTFTYAGNSTTCIYTFTSSVPRPPNPTSIDWSISSTGSYGSVCFTGTGATFSPAFCFDGDYDVTMIVNFSGGAWCYVTQTVTIACSGAITCDPDPSRITAVPDPVVEITYKGPYTCATDQSSSTSGCMYSITGGGLFNIACGWEWALRIPVSPYTCEPFTYYVEYTDADNTDCTTFNCKRHLLDTTLLCIKAKVNTLISVVATGNNCCLPAGYQRGYIWTPTYGSTDHPIGPPITTLGTCALYRACPGGHSGNCTETQYSISQGSGWPDPPNCGITLVNQKVEQRKYSTLNENVNIDQDIIIYTIQGIELFNGKWKFGDPSNLYLNWPKNIGSGLYIVKFQNPKKLTKLLKLD